MDIEICPCCGKPKKLKEPATPLARVWAGHRYGGQVLKPCLELICVAQKPWTKPRLDCIVETGAGALWVEGGRVPTGAEGRPARYSPYIGYPNIGGEPTSGKNKAIGTTTRGRWPPNFAVAHAPPRTCPACDGLGRQTWETWYRGTKDYGGTRREWERLAEGGETIECGYCEGAGVAGGCRRLDGVRRVKGNRQRARNSCYKSSGGIMNTTRELRDDDAPCYADSDGKEAIARYACALRCPACGREWTAEERGPCPGCGEVGEWVCAVRILGEQGGKGGSRASGYDWSESNNENVVHITRNIKSGVHYGDTGTAARFFPNPDWRYEVAERVAGVFPVKYAAKAARAEREGGLIGALPCLKCGEVDSEIHVVDTEMDETIPARLAGSNGLPTLEEMRETARRIKEEKTGKARWVIRTCIRNDHPTVKNIALCRWLAVLMLPPPEYAPRRILIPFGGTMSEAVGALLAGWDEIVAVEISEEYCRIGESRLRFWERWHEATGETEPKALLKAARKAARDGNGKVTREELRQLEMAVGSRE